MMPHERRSSSPRRALPSPARSRTSALATYVCHLRPRSRRWKLLFLFTISLLLFFTVSWRTRNGESYIPNVYSKGPSQSQTTRPEEADLASSTPSPEKPSLSEDGSHPSSLEQSEPSFHLLIRGSQRSANLCRTVASAMLLNYPPPTLVHTDKKASLVKDKKPLGKVTALTAINSYLQKNENLKDDDVVLIVDSDDTWFQLPPEVMLQRFHDMLDKNNKHLERRYGTTMSEDGQGAPVQKFTQKIVFSAHKNCVPGRRNDPACLVVPPSTMAPDIYGPNTDIGDVSRNRPRWLHPGSVMGKAGDVKQLYAEAVEMMSKYSQFVDEAVVFKQIFGEQEYFRELDRQATVPSKLVRVGEFLGILHRTDISEVRVKVVPGRRYEYGIGLDYKFDLLFNLVHSEGEVEWLDFDNVTKLSRVQLEHHVPRESRMNLPRDMELLENPFLPQSNKTQGKMPRYNYTIDALPDYRKTTWRTIPLLVNVHSATVPAVVQVAGTSPNNPGYRWALWQEMWYQPWARALLRKHMRSSSSPTTTEGSKQGATESWDQPGGKGGMWTENGDWLGWKDVCKGFEPNIFGDGHGPWGLETGVDDDAPVYNRWGRLIAGKE